MEIIIKKLIKVQGYLKPLPKYQLFFAFHSTSVAIMPPASYSAPMTKSARPSLHTPPTGQYLTQACLQTVPVDQGLRAMIVALITWLEENMNDTQQHIQVKAALIRYAVAYRNIYILEHSDPLAKIHESHYILMERVTKECELWQGKLQEMGLQKDMAVIDYLYSAVDRNSLL